MPGPQGTVVVREIPGQPDARRIAIAGHATEEVWRRFWIELHNLKKVGVKRVVFDLLCAMSGAHSWNAVARIGVLADGLIDDGGGVVVVSTAAGWPEALEHARPGKITVRVVPTLADALAVLPSLYSKPAPASPPEPPPPPPPVPVERLVVWDQDGANRRVAVEGRIALPSGRLVACDLLELLNGNRHASGPEFELTPGTTCELLSASVVDARGRALDMVGARLLAERPARWERAGRFDNARACFASFADQHLLDALAEEPDFYDGFYYAWIDEAVAIHGGTTEWWEARRLERPGAGSAIVFLSSREGTALPVYAGYAATGALAAVVIEVARAE